VSVGAAVGASAAIVLVGAAATGAVVSVGAAATGAVVSVGAAIAAVVAVGAGGTGVAVGASLPQAVSMIIMHASSNDPTCHRNFMAVLLCILTWRFVW
jgi:hypothetical protein